MPEEDVLTREELTAIYDEMITNENTDRAHLQTELQRMDQLSAELSDARDRHQTELVAVMEEALTARPKMEALLERVEARLAQARQKRDALLQE